MAYADSDLPDQAPRVRLTRDELRQLVAINPLASARALSFDLACIAGVIALAVFGDHLLFDALAVFVVGTRQHALLILMHEGSHKGLLRNQRVCAWLVELLLAWPLGVSMYDYRSSHWAHHRHLNTVEDPDWRRNKLGPAPEEFHFPQSNAQLLRIFALYLTGARTLDSLRSIEGMREHGEHTSRRGGPPAWLRAPYYLVVLAVLIVSGAWHGALLYWLLPAVTVTKFIIMFRTYAEHFGLEQGGRDDIDGTRTVIPNAFERFVFAPHNIGYHLEHHELPGVRFDKLPDAHALLRERGRYADAKIYRSYVEVWRELNGRSAARHRHR